MRCRVRKRLAGLTSQPAALIPRRRAALPQDGTRPPQKESAHNIYGGPYMLWATTGAPTHVPLFYQAAVWHFAARAR